MKQARCERENCQRKRLPDQGGPEQERRAGKHGGTQRDLIHRWQTVEVTRGKQLPRVTEFVPAVVLRNKIGARAPGAPGCPAPLALQVLDGEGKKQEHADASTESGGSTACSR